LRSGISPGGADGVEILHDEQVDSLRWESVNEVVFRAPDDGVTYMVTYQQGLTESVDSDLWNWEDSIKAVEVEEVQVMTTEWKPVKEKS
jgi:hypothetical protein